jgi:hypothetical protein
VEFTVGCLEVEEESENGGGGGVGDPRQEIQCCKTKKKVNKIKSNN